MNDERILNENVATLISISDQDSSNSITPSSGTTDCYLVHQALSFLGTKCHKTND